MLDKKIVIRTPLGIYFAKLNEIKVDKDCIPGSIIIPVDDYGYEEIILPKELVNKIKQIK
jgi:hypothetical protein